MFVFNICISITKDSLQCNTDSRFETLPYSIVLSDPYPLSIFDTSNHFSSVFPFPITFFPPFLLLPHYTNKNKHFIAKPQASAFIKLQGHVVNIKEWESIHKTLEY